MAIISDDEISEVEMWRNVFLRSQDGKEVLAEITVKAHVFDDTPVDDVAAIAVRNFANWMLYRLGVYQDMNIAEIIDNFAKMPYKESEV